MDVVQVIQLVTQGGALALLALLIWKVPHYLASNHKWRMEEVAVWTAERELDRKSLENCQRFFTEQITAERETCAEQVRELRKAIDRMSDYLKIRTHDLIGEFGTVRNVLETKHMQNQGKLDQILTELKVNQRKTE